MLAPRTAAHPTREKAFHALLVAANFPAIRFHDLRQTATTLLLAQGVDPRTIIETLGHSQISFTLKVSRLCIRVNSRCAHETPQ